MNRDFFASELNKIVSPSFPGATYVGNCAYIKLSAETRGKVEFVTWDIRNQYSAIRVSVLDKKGGEIDHIFLHLADLLGIKNVNNVNFANGVKPHIWDDYGNLSWYAYQPDKLDYSIMAMNVCSYLEVFAD